MHCSGHIWITTFNVPHQQKLSNKKIESMKIFFCSSPSWKKSTFLFFACYYKTRQKPVRQFQTLFRDAKWLTLESTFCYSWQFRCIVYGTRDDASSWSMQSSVTKAIAHRRQGLYVGYLKLNSTQSHNPHSTLLLKTPIHSYWEDPTLFSRGTNNELSR